MNVVIFSLRHNAGCFQTQYKNKQTRNITSSEQRHLNFVLQRIELEPPIVPFQIDKRDVFRNESQRPEKQQH